MQKNKFGFTLVELLVVITILAIISVIAYQNFGGAVDKANGSRKVNDVATIETGLQQYKVENNHYPVVDLYNSSTNKWGYSGSVNASPSNTITVTRSGEEISAILTATGGGMVKGIGSLSGTQIGSKGTISQTTLGKTYLSKDLYDPELGDIKLSDGTKMMEKGLGRYVYAVYTKRFGTGTTWGTNNKTGSNYNIAYTIKKSGSDTYITKIVGDFDNEACYDDKPYCPATLIGLTDGSAQSGTTDKSNYGIPYAVTDFQ